MEEGPTVEALLARLVSEVLAVTLGQAPPPHPLTQALAANIGTVLPPTTERLFDKLLKGITFCQSALTLTLTLTR